MVRKLLFPHHYSDALSDDMLLRYRDLGGLPVLRENPFQDSWEGLSLTDDSW